MPGRKGKARAWYSNSCSGLLGISQWRSAARHNVVCPSAGRGYNKFVNFLIFNSQREYFTAALCFLLFQIMS